MSNENKNKLVCNMCDSNMSYYNFNDTHIWICDGGGDDQNVGCPNIQFEFISNKDLDNLVMFLTERQRDKVVKQNDRNIER